MSKDEARCTQFKEMKFDGKTLEVPYACNPTDYKKKCELYFQVALEDANLDYIKTRNKGDNECKCALDGRVNSGYCSSLAGTEMYTKAI